MTERRAGLAIWIATAGGMGYFPIAPGTAGSLVGVTLVVGLGKLPLHQAAEMAVLAVASLVLFAAGVWAAGEAEEFFGRTDPGPVVIDEVVGQMLTFLVMPHATWKWLVGGFLLFRTFDILKPFPARQAERIPRGWGIMLDDVIAGVYSLAVLAVIGLVNR
ncbi:MAG TPA: phosphatidylglycerophosphatase A [Terriglobia bacterium]|nr:phosphatidylglycerophosphatase A [Terriglobia bacterium]